MKILYSLIVSFKLPVFISLIFFFFWSSSAFAQISYMSYADIKSENKKSKKEASRLETEYEDHLINSKRKQKIGGFDTKKIELEPPTDYYYDKEINAIEGNQTQLLAESIKKRIVLKPKKSKRVIIYD